MSETLKQQFTNTKAFEDWKQSSKPEIVGELRRPYKMKTKSGYKKTKTEEIIVFYKEKK